VDAFSADEQVEGLGRAVVEGGTDRFRALLNGRERATKPHLHHPGNGCVERLLERKSHKRHVLPMHHFAHQRDIQFGNRLP
jgi:hypothetical protein